MPRAAEKKFTALLKEKKPIVWSLSGAGGMEKTSLLRRFFDYCKDNRIPVVVLVDLKELAVSDTRELLMQIEYANTD